MKALDKHSTQASTLLDTMRGVAALIVLISHWRNLLFVPYAGATAKPLLVKLFYFVTGGGHQAVIVFFVLSGYLVSSTVVRAQAKEKWSWRVYLEHRFARLWIVLLPALLLVLALDRIGTHLHKSAPLYIGIHCGNMLQNAAAHLGMRTMLGNAFFLQYIYTQTFGSDGALWSLSYEFWYYILFPLLLLCAVGRLNWRQRSAYGILAGCVAVFIGRDVLLLFPVWLMGALLNYLPSSKPRPRLVAFMGIAYIPLLFARSPQHQLLFEYTLGAVTAVLIWFVLGLRENAPKALWAYSSRRLASFSYSLYIIHMPILVLLGGLWTGLNQQQVALLAVLKFFPLIPVCLLTSYGFAWATEFRTEAVRKSVDTRIDLAFPSAQNSSTHPCKS